MDARQVYTTEGGVFPAHSERTQSPATTPGLLSYLLSTDSEDSEDGVRQIRISDQGSRQQHADILIEGVPARGIIDSGAEITIVGGELFQRIAAVARLKKSQLKQPDKIPKTYDRKTFALNGRMDLDVSFGEMTMQTPVYIKMDATEQLLLGEGVCRQLNIITYHPSVFGKGGRKGDEEYSMKKTTRADGTSIHTEFVSDVSCAGAVNKRADSGMEKPSKGRGMPSDVKSHKRALSWSGTATGTGVRPQSSESKTKSQTVSNDAEDGGRRSKEQHSHANVPDVTGVTTSATQTTADLN